MMLQFHSAIFSCLQNDKAYSLERRYEIFRTIISFLSGTFANATNLIFRRRQTTVVRSTLQNMNEIVMANSKSQQIRSYYFRIQKGHILQSN
jgi:hypothetical protein